MIDICVIMTSVKTADSEDEHGCPYMKYVRNRMVQRRAYKQVSRAIMRRTLTAIELVQ